MAIRQGMEHARGTPCHPQTQGKIERWHQTLKNRILHENYFLPRDLDPGAGKHRALPLSHIVKAIDFHNAMSPPEASRSGRRHYRDG